MRRRRRQSGPRRLPGRPLDVSILEADLMVAALTGVDSHEIDAWLLICFRQDATGPVLTMTASQPGNIDFARRMTERTAETLRGLRV